MKNKLVLVGIVSISLALISGCSFDLAKYNPFKKKAATVSEKVYQVKKAPAKSREQVTKEVSAMLDQMVDKIDTSDWKSAISIGEQAYGLTVKEPAFKAPVKDEVYNVNSIKEKLFETLVEAYDYKTHLEGLTKDEKAKYIRVARAHYNINTTEPFKKLALAKILIDTGSISEGLGLATEIYNSQEKGKEAIDTYAWGLYQAGKKLDAYNIYKTFYSQAETLVQLYHSAIVIEDQDKNTGLELYRGCIKHGNNLMVQEPNRKNQSAQSYINMIINNSQKAIDRLLAGGFGVDSKYRIEGIRYYVPPIVVWK